MFNDKSPYKIRIEKTDKGKRYFVSFFDGQNTFQELEVSYEVFIAVYQSVKDIRNLQRSDERHLEHSDLSEQTLNDRIPMMNINADGKNSFQDERLCNCVVSISNENVLLDKQIVYSLLESIFSLESYQKENMQCVN